MGAAKKKKKTAGSAGSAEPAQTLEELAREHIEAKLVAEEILEGSAGQYRRRVDSLVSRAPKIAAMRIDKIERKHIVAIREAYRKCTGQGNTVLAVVKAALGWALDRGLIGADPSSGVKSYPRKKKRRLDLSRAEARAFIWAADLAERDSRITEAQRDFIALKFLLGWRDCEIRRVRTVDIDFERERVRAAHKGDSGRRKWVPVGPETMKIFARRAAAVASGEYLFGGAEPWTHSRPWHIWQAVLPYAKVLGVDVDDPNGPAGPEGTIRPHIARSANIDEKDALGASLPVIAASVNHSRIQQTAEYMGSIAGKLRPLAEQVEMSFLQPPGVGLPEPASLQRCPSPSPTPTPVVREQSMLDNAAKQAASRQTLDVTTAGRAKLEIGERIRRAREAAGLDIKQAASMLAKSGSAWQSWEREGCDRLSNLYEIAALLGVAVIDLLPESITITFQRAA